MDGDEIKILCESMSAVALPVIQLQRERIAELEEKAVRLSAALKNIAFEANREPFALKQNLIIGLAAGALLGPVGDETEGDLRAIMDTKRITALEAEVERLREALTDVCALVAQEPFERKQIPIIQICSAALAGETWSEWLSLAYAQSEVRTVEIEQLRERLAVMKRDRDMWIKEAEIHSLEVARLARRVRLLRGGLRKIAARGDAETARTVLEEVDCVG